MKTNARKLARLLLFVMLIAAALTIFASCAGTPDKSDATTQVKVEAEIVFVVTFLDGTSETHNITTSREFLRGALEDEGLISGDESEYGLYVKTVCGQTLSYEKDGKYWALYVGGQYAMAGVDSTEITDGETYEFRAE